MAGSIILVEATFPDGWEPVRAAAVAQARADEYRAACAADYAMTHVQPYYAPWVQAILDVVIEAMPMPDRNRFGVGDQPPF